MICSFLAYIWIVYGILRTVIRDAVITLTVLLARLAFLAVVVRFALHLHTPELFRASCYCVHAITPPS